MVTTRESASRPRPLPTGRRSRSGSPSRAAAVRASFVSKNLWSSRLVRLPVWERQELTERIPAWRLRGDEAWVTTVGNGMTGPIVITSLRPTLDP
jgi:hypothetical protein